IVGSAAVGGDDQASGRGGDVGGSAAEAFHPVAVVVEKESSHGHIEGRVVADVEVAGGFHQTDRAAGGDGRGSHGIVVAGRRAGQGDVVGTDDDIGRVAFHDVRAVVLQVSVAGVGPSGQKTDGGRFAVDRGERNRGAGIVAVEPDR